jgi:hypothetical protein
VRVVLSNFNAPPFARPELGDCVEAPKALCSISRSFAKTIPTFATRWCRRGHLRERALSGSLANTALTFVPTVCSGTKMKTAIRVYSSRQIVAEKPLNPMSLDSLCVPMEFALAAPLAKFRQLWRIQGSDYRTQGAR